MSLLFYSHFAKHIIIYLVLVNFFFFFFRQNWDLKNNNKKTSTFPAFQFSHADRLLPFLQDHAQTCEKVIPGKEVVIQQQLLVCDTRTDVPPKSKYLSP